MNYSMLNETKQNNSDRIKGQGKLMYMFSTERHRLSTFLVSLLVPRKRNIGAESGKHVRWFTRTPEYRRF
jgi:hypothetical protein